MSMRLEKQELKKEVEGLRKRLTCRVCKLFAVEILFLPCCHVVTCKECANIMNRCVTCNRNVCGTVSAFLGWN